MSGVNEYVAGYEFRGDADYTPTDGERTMIEDAIEGYLYIAGFSERITELLAANNRFEERARVAERQVRQLLGEVNTLLAENQQLRLKLGHVTQESGNVRDSR